MAYYAEQTEEKTGGLQGCAAYQCPCVGSINLDGNDWYCRHHARRPSSLSSVISSALNKHQKLVHEIYRGYGVINSTKERTSAEIQAIAFEQAESLVVSMYEAPLSLLNDEEDKCWPNDYRAFIRGIESLLSAEVNDAIKAHRVAA